MYIGTPFWASTALAISSVKNSFIESLKKSLAIKANAFWSAKRVWHDANIWLVLGSNFVSGYFAEPRVTDRQNVEIQNVDIINWSILT
jgi:hypothetical protein